MEALLETTKWDRPDIWNHAYLVDGTRMLAYIQFGVGVPKWFKGHITLDKRGRTFRRVDKKIFGTIDSEDTKTFEVVGSKGDVYTVSCTEDKWSCSCTSFQFRHMCKHIDKVKQNV